MYMPLNGISINTVTPHIKGNFCQNLASSPNTPGNIKFCGQNEVSLINYVNETFFIQPKSSEIFLAPQKCLLNGQAP